MSGEMLNNTDMIGESFLKLKSYCEKEDFKGWDPYDGLNSSLFNSLPLVSNSRLARLIWIQLFKRNPVNLRKLVGIKKDYNPKGIGLFLNGYCNLFKIDARPEYLEKIYYLANLLIDLQSSGYSGCCWGYNFDWQARAFFQPKGTPTVVATTFIAFALLDAYEITGEQKYLDTAVNTKLFLLNDLNRTYDKKGNFSFSYSPKDSTQVFNASLLGSRLLSRIYSITKEELLIEEARASVQFCCDHQKENGSWSYGTLPFHGWVDNFHTGYNLESIYDFQRYSLDLSFKGHIESGLKYYLETFFTSEGIPKYFDNNMYPIDIHCTSQLILTLSKLEKFDENRTLIEKVLKWTVINMQDCNGFFYYQLKNGVNSKIPYMRWAQAWMFLAFSEYFRNIV